MAELQYAGLTSLEIASNKGILDLIVKLSGCSSVHVDLDKKEMIISFEDCEIRK